MQQTQATAAAGLGKSVAVSQIVKRYGNHMAVNDVSFELGRGEFLTLLGPSGSGKTTSLMMVAGFEHPDSGTIRVNGHDVVNLPPQKRNFGIVFQGYALFPHKNAMENVEFPLKMRRVPATERRRLAGEMLERVGLSGMAHRKPRELSGGQQQRVALARALVFQPDALLLDEPLGALDKNLRERMQYEIKELQRNLGISILFVTHDQEEAMSMSDRIAVMNEGRIVQIGSPSEVYKRPQTAFVAGFLGETNMLTCRVEDIGATGARVSLPEGITAVAELMQPPGAYAAGQQAALSVRPEKVRLLRPDQQADYVLRGRLVQHTFVGRHSRSLVAVGDRRFSVISADAAWDEGLVDGEEIRIGWMREAAQLLPA